MHRADINGSQARANRCERHWLTVAAWIGAAVMVGWVMVMMGRGI